MREDSLLEDGLGVKGSKKCSFGTHKYLTVTKRRATEVYRDKQKSYSKRGKS